MDQDSLSADSFDEQNLISRASPKGYEQQGQQTRSRFSILADMNEANNLNKKAEEQSLLSRYMKDLHEEHYDHPNKNTPNQINLRENRIETNGKDIRKGEQMKSRQLNEYDWKRKPALNCPVQNAENINRLNQSVERSKIKKQSETYGIFVYKMKIDLNKPIDFSLEQHDFHRTYGQSRNSSKIFSVQKPQQEDMLFGNALRQKQNHHHPKNARY